ncbi:glutamate/tyrosine decarboxylase-like PLP-dependent enzyme [Nakamurella sp. UYEF19]|uniref:pyridoxal phosphate-dependent decarboxylase family protein n=1 Tax=Nakamurella sp. UYEF19 TaxID=1756392 RepID=UPI00339098E0
MTDRSDDYALALDRASWHARNWLAGLDSRPVGPRLGIDELGATFGGPLSLDGENPADVIDELATGAEPGLMAIGSGRFFGWVMGGTLPAGLAADWLVSAWDQNAGMRTPMPATSAIEESAARWLLALLGLPSGADVGFVTGATMANFTGLAAARFSVLDRVGWDVGTQGLCGAPRIHVLVGAERHDTVDAALRYLGLGRPVAVAADAQGRIRVDALTAALDGIPGGEPIIVCLQAGNLHSGAFDPFTAAVAAAHRRNAWVHVDGAFGLWAAASPGMHFLAQGLADADSWATDAHKTLNVPYDCGVAVVRDARAMRATFGLQTSYLPSEADGPGNPFERVPELSRRARGVPVWAVLRSLGRAGVAGLVDRLCATARSLATGIDGIEGAEVLNQVVYTQVCIAFGDDRRTAAVTAALLAAGTVWMSGSRWQGRAVLRISVSNWATDDEDVRRSVEAVRTALSDVMTSEVVMSD